MTDAGSNLKSCGIKKLYTQERKTFGHAEKVLTSHKNLNR